MKSLTAAKRWVAMLVVGVVAWAWLAAGSPARAEAFFDAVDVQTLRKIMVQDSLALKTLDTFARQRLTQITGSTTLYGQPALPVVLDMTFRPELYRDRNVIQVENAPLRKDFQRFEGIPQAERDRIRREGTVSLSFLMRQDVQAFLEELRGTATFKADAVRNLQNAGMGLLDLANQGGLLPAAPIPPRAEGDRNWKQTALMMPLVPRYREMLERNGATLMQPPPGYEGMEALLDRVITAQVELRDAWRMQNPEAANRAIAELALLLPAINPEEYPSLLKRRAELLYNQLFQLTIPAAFIYFAAFVLFVLATYSGGATMRIWGLRLFTIAFIVHTLAIAIRWWLVYKSVGDWLESIPIKNIFEAVLFSAWFSTAVGLGLEIWRSKGIWGAAAAFVGWLALVAIYTAPYVTGRAIGAEIGMVAGILMSYWLYVHVTTAVASYALMGMGFMLAVWWLIRNFQEGLQKRSEAGGGDGSAGGGGGGGSGGGGGGPVAVAREEAPDVAGGAIALSPAQTLAAVFLWRRAAPVPPPARKLPTTNVARGPSLEMLDSCNLVMCQLVFWLFGLSVILGAMWADQSWGRPWGWDPKETFSLVNWIVYLVLLHLRLVTKRKALWTAILAIVGFAVMLFNWIGVNFFMVGLHSYA